MKAAGTLLLAALLLCSFDRTALADSWWGRDKALHLLVGFGIGAGCGGTLWALDSEDGPGARLALCAALGQLPGLVKELYDAGQPGNHFSGRDLLWGALGVSAGAAALLCVELLLRSRSEKATRASPWRLALYPGGVLLEGLF